MGRFDEVEVFETFSQTWRGGYELADAESEDTFILRRQRDGEVLPQPISAERIRPAHSEPPLP